MHLIPQSRHITASPSTSRWCWAEQEDDNTHREGSRPQCMHIVSNGHSASAADAKSSSCGRFEPATFCRFIVSPLRSSGKASLYLHSFFPSHSNEKLSEFFPSTFSSTSSLICFKSFNKFHCLYAASWLIRGNSYCCG